MAKNKKNLFLIIFLMVIVNLIIYIRFIKYPVVQEQILGEQLVELTGEINNNNSINDRFIAQDDAIQRIEIFFSTYNRENVGNTTVEILDGDHTIYKTDINNQVLVDNSYYTINQDKIQVDEGKTYDIILSSDIEQGGVTAWKDENNKLVAKITYEMPMTWIGIIKINLVFLILNMFMVKFIRYLRS